MLIEYKGSLTFSIISQLLNKLKEQMDLLGEKIFTYKRILIIMVEILENIHKYIESQQVNDNATASEINFKLAKTDNIYQISATNLVNVEARNIIQCKLDLINKLSPDELKKLYRTIIANGQFTKEGGAGLGFIEIAKTSQSKIHYSFENADDVFSYYT
ncbi:MAG TPA: SiaB family protein kinase, partial [Bacteroidales bacterium]